MSNFTSQVAGQVAGRGPVRDTVTAMQVAVTKEGVTTSGKIVAYLAGAYRVGTLSVATVGQSFFKAFANVFKLIGDIAKAVVSADFKGGFAAIQKHGMALAVAIARIFVFSATALLFFIPGRVAAKLEAWASEYKGPGAFDPKAANAKIVTALQNLKEAEKAVADLKAPAADATEEVKKAHEEKKAALTKAVEEASVALDATLKQIQAQRAASADFTKNANKTITSVNAEKAFAEDIAKAQKIIDEFADVAAKPAVEAKDGKDAQAEVKASEGKLTVAQKAVKTQEEALPALKEAVTKAEAEVAANKDDSKKSELEGKVKTAKEALKAAEEKLSSSKKEVAEMEEKIAEAKEIIAIYTMPKEEAKKADPKAEDKK